MNNSQANETEPVLKKRPKLVWVITIFFILASGHTFLAFVLIYSGVIPVDEAEKSYFDSLNYFDYMLSVAQALSNILGAVLLFLLRRHAFHLFLTAFLILVFSTVHAIMFTDWLLAMSFSVLVGVVIGMGIQIAIILYSRKLIKEGILR
jgi:hypothetical protein